MRYDTFEPRERPRGITILAILEAIGGVLGFLGSILLLTGTTALTGLIGIAQGIIALVIAWGLWTLKPWAFWVTVVLCSLAVIYSIYLSATGNPASLVGGIFSLAIVIYMFADHNVRTAFRPD